MYRNFFKRFFDFLLSLWAILFLFPLFLLIALWIKIDDISSPILFKQTRVGLHKKSFRVYKFRSMRRTLETEREVTVGADPRITKPGAFIRKYKLDELPQLFNILKGDMSIVGPRPEVPQYTQLYTQQQNEIFTVRPGLSDFASLKFINESEELAKQENPIEYYKTVLMPEKVALGIHYAKTLTLQTDTRIVFKTIAKILS